MFQFSIDIIMVQQSSLQLLWSVLCIMSSVKFCLHGFVYGIWLIFFYGGSWICFKYLFKNSMKTHIFCSLSSKGHVLFLIFNQKILFLPSHCYYFIVHIIMFNSVFLYFCFLLLFVCKPLLDLRLSLIVIWTYFV